MGLAAKKSLGQHFLRSAEVLAKIVETSSLTNEDLVLEIGAGEGVLTEALLASGATVIAVETDERALPLLLKRFKEAIQTKQLRLIEGDIRNESTQRELFTADYLGGREYKLIANIPYYITGYLFRLFLETLKQPSLMVFLIQHEVAMQIVATDKKEGMLSLSVKAFGTPRYIKKVPRDAFLPPPKVDSAIIAIEDIGKKNFETVRIEQYFRVLKAGLGSKRKMLIGNLSQTLNVSKTELQEIFTKLSIPHTVRGEDVDVDTWLKITKNLPEQKELN